MAEVSHTPWLTPVIPATWEAKIGRIMDQGQLSQKKKVARTHLHGKKLGMVVSTCYPSYGEKGKIGGLQSRPAWTKIRTSSPK
jgi:hypothetical protein